MHCQTSKSHTPACTTKISVKRVLVSTIRIFAGMHRFLTTKRTSIYISNRWSSYIWATLPARPRRFSTSDTYLQIDQTGTDGLLKARKPSNATKQVRSKSSISNATSKSSATTKTTVSSTPRTPATLISESDTTTGQLDKSATGQETQEEKEAEISSNDDHANADEFLTTIFEQMEPYIDTYAVYKRCLEAGFTPTQSDEIINLLIAQLNTKLSKLLTKYSQIYELENEQYLFESAKEELGVDITRNREHHINEAINSINELERDYTVLSDELNNLLIEMKNDTQIAINDQKSENTLMSKRIMLRIQETNHKITTEITMAMRSEIESLRWHLSRWGVISILTCVITAFVGFYLYRRRLQKRIASAKTEFAPLLIYEPSELDDDDYHADLDPDSV